MALSDNYKKLITILINTTIRGSAIWNVTIVEDQYLIHFKNYELTIFSNWKGIIIFRLLNKDGDSLDNLCIEKGEEGYKSSLELYSLVKRKVMNFDKIIQELQDEILSNDTIGI